MYSTFLRMIVPATETASTMNSVQTEANEAACEPFAELSFWEAVMIATKTSIAAKSCPDQKMQRTQKTAFVMMYTISIIKCGSIIERAAEKRCRDELSLLKDILVSRGYWATSTHLIAT